MSASVHITLASVTSTAVLLKLTARPCCGLGPVAEGGGQMSAVPEKGETVMVWQSSTGRLSLYPPSVVTHYIIISFTKHYTLSTYHPGASVSGRHSPRKQGDEAGGEDDLIMILSSLMMMMMMMMMLTSMSSSLVSNLLMTMFLPSYTLVRDTCSRPLH